MNRGQEIDPLLMQNAHLLGQQRTPTKAELHKMEKDAITMAILQVSTTALNAMLESGSHPLSGDDAANIALQVAKDLLSVSSERENDFEDNIQKRKIRNQIAAQLVYANLRGGIQYKKNSIHRAFNAASKLIEESESYAETEMARDSSTNSIVT